MAIYTSDINRVTGLSGIDTESMIDKMMKAESIKYDNLQREQTWVTWRQEAYREIITAMQDFQNKWFSSTNPSSNVGFDSAWNNYITTVKDKTGKESDAITVTGATQTGKYELEVKQVAQTESITGKGVTSNEIVTGSTIEEITQAIKDTGEVSFKFDLDGDTKEITIKAEELNTSKSVENVFKEKLENVFKGKISVSAKDNKLVFSATQTSSLTISEGKDIASDKLTTIHNGVLSSEKEGKYELKINVDGQEYTIEAQFEKGDSADTRIQKILEAFKNAKTKDEKTVDISKNISISITADGDNLKIENYSQKDEYEISGSFTSKEETSPDTFNSKKFVSTSNLDKLGLQPGKVSTAITEDTKLSQALGDSFSTFFENNKDADGVVKLNFGGKEITVTQDDTIGSLSKKIEAAESTVKLSFNQVTGRFKLESAKSGADNTININADSKEAKFLKILGIDVVNKKTDNDAYVQGQNAKFIVDGIEVERSSNEVNMNGLKFTINGVTDGKVTIESKADEDSTFNMVKSFVDDYNKLIETIEDKVSQKREKSGKYDYYEPLLDSEKSGMSEDEIKKWEEKAKTGLLYKDDLLTGILSNLRNIPYQKIDIGGKEISLFEIGISHGSNYNSGKLEIDETKLKESISKMGDDIADLFTQPKTGIADQMKKVIDDAVGTKGSLRSKAGIKGTSSVTENALSKELQDISKRLQAERERLYNKEMYYFDMFAKMEASMNKQNAQMSMMLSLLGQG